MKFLNLLTPHPFLASDSTANALPNPHSGRAPSLRRFGLVPARAPARFLIEDQTLAPSFFFGSAGTADQEGRLAGRWDSLRKTLGTKLTTVLGEELKKAGFIVSLLNGAQESEERSDDVDREIPPTRDAVLHVAFTEVGMCQSPWSDGYQPKINILARLAGHPSASRWLTCDHFYYGADSSGSMARSIPAESRFRYADVDALIARADEIPEACDIAIAAISRRIAENLCKTL